MKVLKEPAAVTVVTTEQQKGTKISNLKRRGRLISEICPKEINVNRKEKKVRKIRFFDVYQQ